MQAREERQRAAAVHSAAKAEFKESANKLFSCEESARQGNLEQCVEALSRSIAVNSK